MTRLLALLFFIGGVVLAKGTPIEVQEVLALCGGYNATTDKCVGIDGKPTTPQEELEKLHITCRYGLLKAGRTVFCLQPEAKK